MATYEMNDDSVVPSSEAAPGRHPGERALPEGRPGGAARGGQRESRATFVNDEWASFGQLAWTDKRTTSGTWRVARDFPNLPAWTCKPSGAPPPTGRVPPCASSATSSRRSPTTGASGAQTCSIGRSPTMSSRRTTTRQRQAGRDPHARRYWPAGNNNFKVLYAGAKKLGYKNVHTGRMAINSAPRKGRLGCMQIGFCFQGCKSGANGRRCTPTSGSQATGRLDCARSPS